MQRFNVDGLFFDFPDDWQASKYDDWSFYKNQFSRMWNGIKALDLLAIDTDKTAWLIEVKDYRVNPRTKPSDLAEEIAHKVFDTLAAIIPAKIHATDPVEKQLAHAVSASRKLRVVLHLEQPAKHSKLRPRAIKPADVQQKTRQLLKPVDAHALVVEIGEMRKLAWHVS
ncbi:MAG: hypothetical protein Q7U38_11920 [Methylobacter sp.]|nr:hypothetical protein [Methylobacter sp.]MDP2100800.1 hypothetical protein [Methylobacter sp.]MDP2427071.1 hypothetical protein [Methylobacter sp.]MDP3053049.1 hypothetical protein [Methylobacter sp.]MDP3363256.1 hypothetical protein [Methylobacter sp.]